MGILAQFRNIKVVGIVLSTVVGIAGVIATWFAGEQTQRAFASAITSEMVGTAAEHGVAINAKGGAKVSVVVDSLPPAKADLTQPPHASPLKTGMHADARAAGTVVNADGNAEVKVTRSQQPPGGVK